MGFGPTLVRLVPYVARCPYSSSKTPIKCTPSSSIDLQGDFLQFVSMLHFEISHVTDSFTFSYVYCVNITNTANFPSPDSELKPFYLGETIYSIYFVN
ncbi:hypothetical protein GJAV_G00154900 [Gymnothorax javanicus]|nr:hypothetical protein GJAV_G00154900 [Gymnothorax javanicus]